MSSVIRKRPPARESVTTTSHEAAPGAKAPMSEQALGIVTGPDGLKRRSVGFSGPAGALAKGIFATFFTPFVMAQRHFVHARLVAMAPALHVDRKDAARACDAIASALAVAKTSFMVLRDDFHALQKKPEVIPFLAEAQRELTKAKDGLHPVDLYDIALRHAGSRNEAVRWLAVLFQDKRPFFLIAAGDSELAQTLSATLRLLEDVAGNGNVRLYPPGVESEKTGLYHFYVPALLALRLADDGFSERLSLAAPTVFNAEYEIQQAALADAKAKPGWWSRTVAGTKHVVGVGTGAIAVKDLRDIELGGAGARFALGLPAKPMPATAGDDVVAGLVAWLT